MHFQIRNHFLLVSLVLIQIHQLIIYPFPILTLKRTIVFDHLQLVFKLGQINSTSIAIITANTIRVIMDVSGSAIDFIGI